MGTTEKELFTFRVIGGEHIGNKRTYPNGFTFKSRYPLDTWFVGKFQRIAETPVVIDDEEGPAKRLIPKKKPVVLEDFDFSEAADVTHMFPAAKESDLVVYKNETGGYAVAEAGAKVLINLAGEVLGTKKKVNEFLASFAESGVKED